MEIKTSEEICQKYTGQLDNNRMRNKQWVRVDDVKKRLLNLENKYKNDSLYFDIHPIIDELSQSNEVNDFL